MIRRRQRGGTARIGVGIHEPGWVAVTLGDEAVGAPWMEAVEYGAAIIATAIYAAGEVGADEDTVRRVVSQRMDTAMKAVHDAACTHDHTHDEGDVS